MNRVLYILHVFVPDNPLQQEKYATQWHHNTNLPPHWSEMTVFLTYSEKMENTVAEMDAKKNLNLGQFY